MRYVDQPEKTKPRQRAQRFSRWSPDSKCSVSSPTLFHYSRRVASEPNPAGFSGELKHLRSGGSHADAASALGTSESVIKRHCFKSISTEEARPRSSIPHSAPGSQRNAGSGFWVLLRHRHLVWAKTTRGLSRRRDPEHWHGEAARSKFITNSTHYLVWPA